MYRIIIQENNLLLNAYFNNKLIDDFYKFTLFLV